MYLILITTIEIDSIPFLVLIILKNAKSTFTLGMNCDLMVQYIKFVADRLLVELECEKVSVSLIFALKVPDHQRNSIRLLMFSS